MNFTFGIVTSGKDDVIVDKIIDSIEAEQMETYEILVIGPSKVDRENCRVIYDEQTEMHPIRKNLGWITKKKNIIAQEAQYDYIVFMHDYIRLLSGWYNSWDMFLKGNGSFEIGVNFVYTYEGPRHADWMISPVDMWELFPRFHEIPEIRFNVQLPIHIKHLTKFQYISGGYWVATKKFSLDNPQLEQFGWGEYEDIEWARLVRGKTKYQFNASAGVQLLKPGKWQPKQLPDELLQAVENYNTWLEKNLPHWNRHD